MQRNSDSLKNNSFVFIKNNESKNYIKVDNDECEAVNFVKMATELKTDRHEKAVLPIIDNHYEQVKSAIEYYENELNKITTQVTNIKVEHKNDKQAIKLFKSWLDKAFIEKDMYDIFTKTIRDGRLQNLSKEIISISKKYQSFEITNKLKEIQNKYSLFEKEIETVKIEVNIDIILSETFV